LSTTSCEGLRSPWRGEGSAAIRTRGAAIRVLVRGQQISDEAADQEGAHPLADEGDRNSPLKAKASARPQEIVSFELHLQAATKQMPITPAFSGEQAEGSSQASAAALTNSIEVALACRVNGGIDDCGQCLSVS